MDGHGNRPYIIVTLLLVLTLLGTLVLTTVPAAQAADVYIDTFVYVTTSIRYEIDDPNDLPVFLEKASATGNEMLGSQRDLCLEVTTGDEEAYATFRTSAVNQYLTLALDDSVRARAIVQWDGITNTNCTLDPVGLRVNGKGRDLTGNESNDGILLRIIGSDNRLVIIKMRIYTDGDNWSQSSVNFTSQVLSPEEAVDIFLPFEDFTPISGTVSFTDVGAVELELDATAIESVSADMTIKMVKATSVYDYGDLPSAYGSAVLDARHIVQGMRLGYSVDAEAGNYASAEADGDDDNDWDDEDGVTRYLPDNWAPGTGGGTVLLTVRGCTAAVPCYVSGWVDWEKNDDFADAGEQILNDRVFNEDATNQQITFDIPAGTTFENDAYYARFRICQAANACNSVTATNVRNGEVEDYRWYWGPTAVRLTSFTAAPAGAAVLVAWETASEHDNAGFHLYRGADLHEQGERLNQLLIPSSSPGGDQGATYEFLDTTAQPGQTYYYTLEDVDFSGLRTSHGPAVVATPYTIFLPLVQR